jgi:hypothetical protein
MRDIVKLVLILTIALGMTCSVYAAELLINGDFEDDGGLGAHGGWDGDVPGWTRLGDLEFYQHSDPDYFRDNYGLAMWNEGSALFQAIPVSLDDFFTMSGSMIYSPIYEPLTSGSLALRLEFWDDAYPAGSLLDQTTVGILSADDTPDSWKDVERLILTPTGTSQVRVVLDYYGSNGGKAYFDDISLLDENTTGQAGGPIPQDGAAVKASTTTEVRWVNSVNTGPTQAEVMFRKEGDPNSIILDRQDITSWVGQAPLPTLEEDTNYVWTVNYYNNSSDKNPEVVLQAGFNTGNMPPQINLIDQYVWLSMDDGDDDPGKLSLELDGNVEDDGKSLPLNYFWESVFADSSVPEIGIDPNDTEVTTAVFYATGHWTIKLTVDDGQWQDEDTTDIYVYSTPCQAAIGDPEDAELIGDLDGDCDTDLEDFVQFTLDWMYCMSEKLGCIL